MAVEQKDYTATPEEKGASYVAALQLEHKSVRLSSNLEDQRQKARLSAIEAELVRCGSPMPKAEKRSAGGAAPVDPDAEAKKAAKAAEAAAKKAAKAEKDAAKKAK